MGQVELGLSVPLDRTRKKFSLVRSSHTGQLLIVRAYKPWRPPREDLHELACGSRQACEAALRLLR